MAQKLPINRLLNTKFTFKIILSELKLKRFDDFLFYKVKFRSLSKNTLFYEYDLRRNNMKRRNHENARERHPTRALTLNFFLRIDYRGAFDPAKLLIKGIPFVLAFFRRLQIIFIRNMIYLNSVFLLKSLKKSKKY